MSANAGSNSFRSGHRADQVAPSAPMDGEPERDGNAAKQPGAVYTASLFGYNHPESDPNFYVDAHSFIDQSCEKLVGLLGVYNVWIALTSGDVITASASSFDQGFAPLKERMIEGWRPICLRRAISQKEVVIIEDVEHTCWDCPLSTAYSGRVGIACRIERQGEVFGILRASAPEYMAHDLRVREQIVQSATQLAEILHQIAERKKVENELRESRRQLATLMDNLPGMAYRCHHDGRWTMVFVSEGCLPLTGYSKEDLLDNRRIAYADLIHPEDRSMVQEAVNEGVSNRRPFTIEYRIVHASGEERWVWERGRSVEIPESGQLLLEGFIADVTDRLRLEEHVLHLQKQESLSVMAGGVAHDFNNILTAIIGNAEVAMTTTDCESEVHQCLSQIVRSSQEAAELCHQLLYFCGRSISILAPIDLNRIIESMKPLFGTLTARNIQLEFSLAGKLPEFQADPADVRQLIMQLTMNATESYQGRDGAILIASGTDHYNGKPVEYMVNGDDPPAGAYVWISVNDHGCGMDLKTRTRMFDPFYSTKFTGRGMGLAAVLGIVRARQGRIIVVSQPGKGTTIKVLFPVTGGRPVVAFPASPADSSPPAFRRTILLVDDEAALRTLSTRMLQREGCTVISASNGREAVDIYRKRHAEIDLVLMDLTMPEMDGIESFKHLQAINPRVRVVLTTGYSVENITQRIDLSSVFGVLIKPFTREDILRLVRGERVNPPERP